MAANGLETYRKNRDLLLSEITERLSADERLLAAWLTGSFGRNDYDGVSDLDLTVVVANEFSEKLCARPEMVSGQTTDERFDLIRQFGEVALIHENNHNAPEGGSFTFALYAGSALMVDWVLIPLENANRPPRTLLLFDKAGIAPAPERPSESLEQRARSAGERIAFFWMMSAITAKYIVRRDDLWVQVWLEELRKLIGYVRRLMAGEPPEYRRGSVGKLAATAQGQVEELRRLGREMADLTREVARMGGKISSSPVETIEALLNLAPEQDNT